VGFTPRNPLAMFVLSLVSYFAPVPRWTQQTSGATARAFEQATQFAGVVQRSPSKLLGRHQ
jgi:hypothetical protein